MFQMIKQLGKSVREYKKPALLTPLFITIEVILEILIPTLMASLIDYGIDAGNLSVIVRYGLILLGCSFVSLAAGVIAGKTASIASCGFAANLRHDMFYKVQNYSFSNIDKFSTAGIVTRLTTDVTNVQMAFQMIIRITVRSPLMLVASMIAALRIDVKLSLIFLACIPVLAFGLWFIMTRVHGIFKRVFKTYDKLNNIVGENLHGIRVVKSYTREEHEKSKFGKISEEIYRDFTKAEKMIAFNAPLMQGCMYASMLLISWFGARAIIASGGNPEVGLSTGELMSLITYAMQVLSSLMMVSMIIVMMTISRASAERISEVLSEESDIQNGEHPATAVPDGSVTFENVTFSYARKSDKPVLNGINLSIASGETVGILGATGSSKSSLVQLIPRLYDVSEGRVLVGGRDVREYDIETLRNEVAMVLQKNVLYSGTIKENLRWGNEHATDEQLEHACRLASADEFIRAFPDGYDTHIEQGGTNVSGGQKQRLCIARALLKNPKILILDDSTSAVDTKTDAMIRRAFAEDIPNTTKIIIAQRVSSVMHADKIVVMDDGAISAVGTHEELLASSPIYKEVYQSQEKGGDEA